MFGVGSSRGLGPGERNFTATACREWSTRSLHNTNEPPPIPPDFQKNKRCLQVAGVQAKHVFSIAKDTRILKCLSSLAKQRATSGITKIMFSRQSEEKYPLQPSKTSISVLGKLAEKCKASFQPCPTQTGPRNPRSHSSWWDNWPRLGQQRCTRCTSMAWSIFSVPVPRASHPEPADCNIKPR